MVCSAMFCKKNLKKISDPIYIEKGWLPPSEELFESLELRAALKTIRVEQYFVLCCRTMSTHACLVLWEKLRKAITLSTSGLVPIPHRKLKQYVQCNETLYDKYNTHQDIGFNQFFSLSCYSNCRWPSKVLWHTSFRFTTDYSSVPTQTFLLTKNQSFIRGNFFVFNSISYYVYWDIM